MTPRDHKAMHATEAITGSTDGLLAITVSKWGMSGGTVAAALGWLTSNGAAVLIGICVTVLGFVINYIFQRRRDRREAEQAKFSRELELAEEKRRQELHEVQLLVIRTKIDTK